MTAKDLAIVMRGIAPVLKEYVALGMADFTRRLDALETQSKALEIRSLAQGRDGKDGLPGEKGSDGAVGPAGERGPEGPAGKDGAPGERGADGASGDRGPEGPVGPAGRDGLPGRDGMAGPAGEKGLDGTPGRDGINGRDGTLENIKMLFDGERTVTFCFKDGTPVEGGTITFPVQLQRGVYTEGKSYDHGDVVTWGGSQWHANETTSTKPGEGSKAWTLVVKRGRDGRDGKDAVSIPVVSVGGTR